MIASTDQPGVSLPTGVTTTGEPKDSHRTRGEAIWNGPQKHERINLSDHPYPYWQMPPNSVASLLLRLGRSPDAVITDGVRRAVYAVDPLVATMRLQPLSDAASAQVAQERYTLAVLQVLSGLALGLATRGLFAVMAYNVAQRMGEFGVRLALGTIPPQLFRLVLKRGLMLTTLGVLVGFGAAWALTRFLRSLLFETSAVDPLIYIIVGLVLLLAAGLRCWLPARRAMRVDVARLLRSE